MKKKVAVAIIMIIAMLLPGCNSTGQKYEENRIDAISFSDNLDIVALARNVLQKEAIYTSTGAHYMRHDWNEEEYHYICNDIYCNHMDKSCTAFTADESDISCDNSLAFEYNGKLIILDAYLRNGETALELNENESSVCSWTYTTIFEADLDGGNRRKVAEFLGGPSELAFFEIRCGLIVHDGIMYFAGAISHDVVFCADLETGEATTYEVETDQCYAVNLTDYSVQTFFPEQHINGKTLTVSIFIDGDDVCFCKSKFLDNYANNIKTVHVINKNGETVHEAELPNGSSVLDIRNDIAYIFTKDQNVISFDLGTNESSIVIEDVQGAGMLQDGFFCERHKDLTTLKDMIYYTFDLDGNIQNSYKYDNFYAIGITYGDYFIVSDRLQEKLYMIDPADLENLDENRIFIGYSYPTDCEELDSAREQRFY